MIDTSYPGREVFYAIVAAFCFFGAGMVFGAFLIANDRDRTKEALRPLNERIAWEQQNSGLIADCVKQHRLDWKTCASAEYHTRDQK